MRAKTSLLRRIGLFSLKLLAGLLLLLALLLGGGLIWLRGEGAAEVLKDTATGLLADQGLILRLDSLSGPLPHGLRLEGVELADTAGPLLRARVLDVRLRLSALLKGALEVESLRLEAPEVIRLPQGAEQKEAEASGGIPVLPVDIVLGSLEITGGRLHGAALAPPPESPSPEEQLPPVLDFALSGTARLAGESLSARVRASLLEQDRGLRLEAELASSLASLRASANTASKTPPLPESPEDGAKADAGRGREGDRLRLSLHFSDGEQGLLHRLLDIPGLPPLGLSLEGDGPVRDWHAALEYAAAGGADAGSPDEASLLLGGRARLGLRCASGSLWRDLVLEPAFALSLENSLRGGGATPPELAPLLAEPLNLKLKAQAARNSHTADLALTGKDLALSVNNLRMAPDKDGGSLLTAALSARLADLPALLSAHLSALSASGAAATGPAAPETKPRISPAELPLQALSLSAQCRALLGPESLRLDLTGDIGAQSAGAAYPLSYALTLGQKGGNISLESLRLEGLGLLADVSAALHAETLALQARALITAEDGGAWQSLAAALSGQEIAPGQSPSLGGAIRAEIDLNFPGLPGPAPENGAPPLAAQGPATGGVRLTASSLRWPTPELEHMLGEKILLTLSLSGPPSGPYNLTLDECRAGIFSATGGASLTPGQGADPAAELAAGHFTARAEARVNDLTPLAGQGVTGGLDLRLAASGPVRKPELELTVSSPAVGLPGGQRLRSASLTARAVLELLEAGLQGGGDIGLSLADSPGGPLSLTASWRAEPPGPASPAAYSLKNLRLSGAGLDARADLTAALPQNAPPALEGSFSAEVRDWKKIGALAGTPLSGQPARLDLRLENSDSQSARLTLSAPSLKVPPPDGQPGRSVVSLNKVALQARISDLFGAPGVDASLETGPGRAAFLSWATGRGAVRGTDGRGDFSLALEQKRRGPRTASVSGRVAAPPSGRVAAAPAERAAAPAGRAAAARGGKERKASGLTLAGAYDLRPEHGPLLRLDALSLFEPRSQSGLALNKPLTVTLADGLAVQGADLAFEPAGRLAADAAFTPQGMRLKADLKALPLAFFKLFGLSTLPDGEISASADLRANGGAAQGGFSLLTRLSATQTASGLERDSLPEADSVADRGAGFSASPVASPAASPAASVAASVAAALPPVFELSLSGRLTGSGSGMQLAGEGLFGSAANNADAKKGRLSFRLPLQSAANGLPVPDTGAPLSASVNWNGPVETLWQAVPLPDTYLSGPLLLDAAVSGSLNAPKARVKAYMAGGRLEDVASGLLIRGIDLEAANDANNDVRLLLSASDEHSGKLAAEATLKGFAHGSPVVSFRSQLDAFRPLHRDDVNISLSGYCGVEGPLDTVAVSGRFRVDQGELLLSGDFGGSVPLLDVEHKPRQETEAADQAADQADQSAGSAPAKAEAPGADGNGAATAGDADNGNAEAAPALLGPALDLQVVVPRYFFIRGMGVDSEWRGDLRIKGHAAEPALHGFLAPVRGTVDVLARDFAFDPESSIRFDGSPEPNPVLNLTLAYENPDIKAYVLVGGSVKKLKFDLKSEPSMPRDEILSHVLFGKSPSELSRFEAVQLADSLSQLSGGGGATMGLLTDLRKETGLDTLRVGGSRGADKRGTAGLSGEGDLEQQSADDSGEAGAPALEAGKYITDSIYVGVEQGMTEDSTAVRVEVELFPSVTLQGKSGTEASEVGVGWKMDY